MIQVIASPEKFDGKPISMIGFLSLEPEGEMLYLSYSDYSNGISENGLWIRPNAELTKDSEKLDMNYVRVVGIFSSKHIGYALTSGGLIQVSSCSFWSELKNPRM